MERDAIPAGVAKIGGLFTTAEIRILICYILSSIKEPIPANALCEVLHHEAIANAFEVSDSLAFLEKEGHILEVTEPQTGFIITNKGKYVAKTLKTSVSSVTIDRAYSAVLKMMVRSRNAKENDFKITRENDKIFLTCSALDRDVPFMSVKLMVSDEDQAIFIKDKFLNNASQIYSKLIEMLTKED